MESDDEKGLASILPCLLKSLGKGTRTVVAPDGSKSVIRRRRNFGRGNQEDTGEFVTLLDDLHEGLAQLRGRPTIIEQLFGPTFDQVIECHHCCARERCEFSPGPVIPLALDPNVTDGQLESYIRSYTASDGELSEWDCGNCSFRRDEKGEFVLDSNGKKIVDNKRSATRSVMWSTNKLPPFLIFQFGTYASAGESLRKSVPDNLTFPPELHMDSSMPGISGDTPYSLIGTAEHHGGLNSGHYLASVRLGDEWFQCSDGMITASGHEAARSQATPYLFVYRRANPIDIGFR
jgi:ubiquitin C-terminal hydrolase